MRRRSLRLKVTRNFASFGAVLGLALSVGLYFYVHDMSQHLMYETLLAEMQDYQSRLAYDPNARLPSTLTLSGHIVGGKLNSAAPLPLVRLPPGRQALELNGTPYLALVGDYAGQRLVFLYNRSLQQEREHHFLYFLLAGMAIMTVLSAIAGYWLVSRVVAPVTELATRVAAMEPPGPSAPPAASKDEIDELAHTFDRCFTRIRECAERERSFTADVSHELRTPLAIIRGAVEVLESDANLNNDQRQRLARIERASHDMTDLTNALLHLARGESQNNAEPPHCSIAEVTRESVEKHQILYRDAAIDITLALDEDIQQPVERTLASVVVDNLIDNAIRHSHSGRIDVRLADRCLAVSDCGKGIAQAELDRIFLRHYRGSASNGAGIGLSLVKRICDLSGWRIEIDSQPGRGTTARLLFA